MTTRKHLEKIDFEVVQKLKIRNHIIHVLYRLDQYIV